MLRLSKLAAIWQVDHPNKKKVLEIKKKQDLKNQLVDQSSTKRKNMGRGVIVTESQWKLKWAQKHIRLLEMKYRGNQCIKKEKKLVKNK